MLGVTYTQSAVLYPWLHSLFSARCLSLGYVQQLRLPPKAIGWSRTSNVNTDIGTTSSFPRAWFRCTNRKLRRQNLTQRHPCIDLGRTLDVSYQISRGLATMEVHHITISDLQSCQHEHLADDVYTSSRCSLCSLTPSIQLPHI